MGLRRLYITGIMAIIGCISVIAQEVPVAQPGLYHSAEGQVFVHPMLPLYLFAAPESNPREKHLVPAADKNHYPVILEQHGEHLLTHTNPTTGESLRYPVFADGKPPQTEISFNKGLILKYRNRYFCDALAEFRLIPSDDHSGVAETWLSVNGGEFRLWQNQDIGVDKDFRELQWFSVDKVGNTEEVNTADFVFDVQSLITFETLYFGYNSAGLRAETIKQLDAIASRLRGSSGFDILIEAHTDARGHASYNLRLSQERGDAVKAYLARRGIENQRMSVEALGETQLANHCLEGVECSEEQHQLNRRVEFKIVLPQ